MIYTNKTKAAMKLCFEAHKEQKDKSGQPYVFHPFHVAEQMDDEESTVVALLHDVVEDSDYSLDDIAEVGFGDAVVEALRLLTHEDGMPYLDYIRRIRTNPLATKVKLADLAHNSDLSRLDREPNDTDIERVEKYRKSREILSPKFQSKRFSDLTAEELYEILKSRNEIFVIEQDCIFQDCDDRDYGYHVFCRDESGRVTAYMRIYEIDEEPEVILLDGQAIWSGNLTEEQIKAGTRVEDYDAGSGGGGPCEAGAGDVSNCGGSGRPSREDARTVQMGRVLTLEHGKGLGRELLEEGIRTAWDIMGADRIFIEAEDYVEGYYTKAGFIRTSDVFLKDDIPHVHMEFWR